MDYSLNTCVRSILIVADLFYNRYKNQADIFSQLFLSPLGGAIAIQEEKKLQLQRK